MTVKRMTGSLLGPLLVLLSAVEVAFENARLFVRQLILAAKFPGPFAWPVVGNSLYFERSGPGFVRCIKNLWEDYGSVLRVWVGPMLQIAMMSARDTEVILSGYKHMSKGLLYKYLHPWLGQGLLTSSGEHWRAHRKIITPTFHFKILEQFLPVFNNNSDIFIRLMHARAGGPSFDVFPMAKLLTLDVICESAMGVKVNAQLDSSSEYVAAVTDFTKIFLERVLRPWLIPDFVFCFTSMGRRHKQIIGILHGTTDAVIRKRKQELVRMQGGGSPLTPDELGRKKRVAFLDLLLLSQRAGAQLSDRDIREEVDTFMFEGHDTTASAVAWTLWLLSKNEDAQNKIVEELTEICGASKQLELTPQGLGELKYVEMVLKESMRLYPPVPLIFRVVDSDVKLPSCGASAPQGSSALLGLYGLHRQPDIFPDPERFDPGRFSPEACVGRDPFAYVPFSAGPRNCLGQRFAMMELKMIIAKVIYNFKLLPEPDFEPVLSYELIMKSANGLRIKLENRRG